MSRQKKICLTKALAFCASLFFAAAGPGGNLHSAGYELPYALEFDGSSDYIDLPVRPRDIDAEGVTFSCRIKIAPGAGDDRMKIFSGYSDRDGDTRWDFEYNHGGGHQLAFNEWGGAGNNRSNKELEEDVWYFVSFVWEPGEKVTLYVDGEKDTEHVIEKDSLDNGGNFRIAGRPDGSEKEWEGIISDVSLWRVARTQQEIREEMKGSIAGREEGLVGYWPLGEGSGEIAHDRSAKENHGKITGASWKRVIEPRALLAERPERVLPVLLDMARDRESNALRLDALEVLGRLDAPAEDITPVLLGILKDGGESDEVRIAALDALGQLDVVEEKLAPILPEILKNAEEREVLRLKALAVLDETGAMQEETVRALLSILKDGGCSEEVRLAALHSLKPSDFEEDKIGAVLLDILKNREEWNKIRLKALETLLEFDYHEMLAADTGAVELLLQLSVPQNAPGLRAAAVEALNGMDVDLPAEAGDWPMWRYDAARSADTPHELADEIHLQWVRELPEPKRAWIPQRDARSKLDFDVSYSPVVMGDKIFVPSSVTDSVTAYSTEDGAEVWRFYTDGPVRLAPAGWDGRVYFTSDDGHLYCVEAGSGELQWKFRGGPSDLRLLGNERIINIWAARGAPVVADGTVYFAAGIFPQHGVFIYALDAESGEVQWVNDTISTDARSRDYGVLSPQGYMAASEEGLVVSGGRSLPIHLDRTTGRVQEASFVTPFNRTGRWRAGSDNFQYGGFAVHAVDGGDSGWRPEDMKRNENLERRLQDVSDRIEGEVFYKLAARDRLFVMTEDGTLYCFGPEQTEPQEHGYSPASLEPMTDDWADIAVELLDELDDDRGYALMLGAGSGDLLRELLIRSDLHVVVVEPRSEKARSLRDELAAGGKYGVRAAVIEAEPATFAVQPYLFSLIVSEDAPAAGADGSEPVMKRLLDRLRPYGGVAWLGAAENELSAFSEAADAADVDQVSVQQRSGHLLATRAGPLTGAGEWTHQYHDPSNTLLSRDTRVRNPLGVLWYGGTDHYNLPGRHSYAPRPHVVRGRLIAVGWDTISARCVYTGRELWVQNYEGVGDPWRTTGRYILGAAYIGSNFVSLPDSIYLRHKGRIYRLDPETGEEMDVFDLPGRSPEEIYGDMDGLRDWGHISVQGDYIITTAEPHFFEGQGIGELDSFSATSSRMLAVMDRRDGEVQWTREAQTGFRHTAIVSSGPTLYAVDGVSESVEDYLARRGEKPEEPSELLALELESGQEKWVASSEVFGTYLLYSEKHDVLVEGRSRDAAQHHFARLSDEWIGNILARSGSDGEIIWKAGGFTFPGAVYGDMLIPGRPGAARSVLTGEIVKRRQPLTGQSSDWRFNRLGSGCNTLNASEHLLLFRGMYAGFFDLEYDSGTGSFGGFRSGCTASMIAADGVLNSPDYTRTCTCAYPLQTSVALVHMPGDPNIEFWTRFEGAYRNPEGHGINYGAPGRRVDAAGGGLVWHDESGTKHRHPSAIKDAGGSIPWVSASVREGEGRYEVADLRDGAYAVRLHFAELNEDAGPGDRVFDVLIDGEPVLENFDIASQTGGALRALVKELEVDIEGGSLLVEFRSAESSEFEPLIGGIEFKALSN